MKVGFNNMVSIDLKGNLLFSIAPDFTRQFMITSWNSGMRFYLKTDEGWLEEDIDTGLLLVSDENIGLKKEPISIFLKQMPSELIALAEPYRYRQFSLLQLIAQHPQLFDIFKHSPNLFWMLVVEAESRDWSKHELVEILQQKRELIIKKILDIKCKKRVRLVQKLIFYRYIRCEFELIKKALKMDKIVTAFEHWKSIPIQVIPVVIEFPYFLETHILENEVDVTKSLMSHQRKFWKYKEIIDDITRMAESMGTELTDRYKSHLHNEASLNHLHVNWIIRFNHSNEFIQYLLVQANENNINQVVIENQILSSRNQHLPVEKCLFPPCPLGDATSIVQIKNNFELLAEGLVMNHCVGSYTSDVLKENSYFYKVLSPERATLQIVANHGNFNIKQFKLRFNKKPSALSYQAVYEWLQKVIKIEF